MTTIRKNSERLIWAHLWQHLAVCDRTCSLRPSLSEAPYFSWKMLKAASWHLLTSLLPFCWRVHHEEDDTDIFKHFNYLLI